MKRLKIINMIFSVENATVYIIMVVVTTIVTTMYIQYLIGDQKKKFTSSSRDPESNHCILLIWRSLEALG